MSLKKMGFWSVFALVTGSQIGSGVFMLPASLAPYGMYSLLGWLLSGIGAIALALVFAQLCAWFPQTGGPHVYIHHAFGKTAAFFTGWTYWVISWVSTSVVVLASIGYLLPVIGVTSPWAMLALELGLLLLITALNFRGVAVAGSAEFVLTLLKVIPLIIIPLIALAYFSAGNMVVSSEVAVLPLGALLSRVALLTLWGFIGLESATTAAGAVDNPSRTIPRAVVAGTIVAALLYVLNSVGIMGALPANVLALSAAPYADAVQTILGGQWHVVIALIASVICVGTLNAWMLTSGQIALGLAQDGLMPAFFKRKNRFEAPYVGLSIAALGIMVLLFLTSSAGIANQILMIIDLSVLAFLFVYALSCIACMVLLWRGAIPFAQRWFAWLFVAIGLVFCCWVIAMTPLATIVYATIFTLCGIPMYYYLRRIGHV